MAIKMWAAVTILTLFLEYTVFVIHFENMIILVCNLQNFNDCLLVE
jgi:hypothetical protein